MAKVLLIAPTDRDDVGEAWVSYQWAHRLSLRHEVTLLTYHKRGKPRATDQLPHARVVEWTEPRVLGRAERLNSLLKPAWIPFHLHARRWIRRALAAGERFDLAHQPVPVAMRYPSPVAGLGIPYLIGPVGGSLSSPAGFAGEDTAPWYVRLRALDAWRMRHDRLLRRTYEDAAVVLAIAPYVTETLAGLRLQRLEFMSETGIAALPPPVDRAGREGPVRLLFVGRLIRTKGVRDAINALAHLRDVDVVLDVVGDGFDRTACEARVAELELGDRVRFHGEQPRERVTAFYEQADVFVFPSYREPGGNVVFEAMAAGLPLVVCGRGGPGNVVDESCGVRLVARDVEQYAHAIADAVRPLATDAALRARLGEGARRRAADVALWDRKIDAVEALYADVVAAAAVR